MKIMRCPSYTSSSSCIESPINQNDDDSKPKPKTKTKRIIPNKKKILSPNPTATSPKSRSSIYRGVTRHKWTGRYEAHLWDKTTWNSIQNKRGKQIYLGAYDNEEDAARTYDLAALKYWGPNTILNFPMDAYAKQMEEMQKFTREEYLASLRRRSSGFSRGVSKYRGVASNLVDIWHDKLNLRCTLVFKDRHHHNGRWEARIGRVCGNKYLYLGTYSTEEEAAAAYDMAAIEFRGSNAVTNFNISNYADKLSKDEKAGEMKQKTNPDPLDSKVNEEESHHVPHQQNAGNAVQWSAPKLESMDSIPSPFVVVMDPADHHEHPWDFCLDIGFNMPAFPDVLMEETSEVFDYRGFEDGIEYIFDGPFVDNEILLLDAISGSG